MILLGERGQAKTPHRALAWSSLLDDGIPVAGRRRDQRRPARPDLAAGRRAIVAELGDATPIELAAAATDRYGEKLATPDITIADLIGEVDPIKVAEGRYLSDELTIHYGLLPRTQPRHLRAQRAARPRRADPGRPPQRHGGARRPDPRLPGAADLDLFVVASANPEDYTNRGRIITPLKDRFGVADPDPLPADARARDRDHGGRSGRAFDAGRLPRSCRCRGS